MPWTLEQRDGRWCVIKEADGSNEGCHPSRAEAIKHQRALYANEARMASMYDHLDAQPEPQPFVPSGPVPSQLGPLATELVGLLLKDDRERSLTASLVTQQEQMATRMEQEKLERQALIAALQTMQSPVVNVAAPDVQVDVEVPTPQVTVEAPNVTVEQPAVNVQVAAPEVTVNPNIIVPNPTRKVTVEHDPLTQRIVSAEVTDA